MAHSVTIAGCVHRQSPGKIMLTTFHPISVTTELDVPEQHAKQAEGHCFTSQNIGKVECEVVSQSYRTDCAILLCLANTASSRRGHSLNYPREEVVQQTSLDLTKWGVDIITNEEKLPALHTEL